MNLTFTTADGTTFEFATNPRGTVFWSDNWIALIDESRNGKEFTRHDDGPGTFGSTSIKFNTDRTR